jgi:hypothetical protein
MKKIVLLFGGLVLLFYSCTPEAPLPIEPSIATLLSPANNEACLDGVSLNDSQSNVSFNWSNAQNALSYEVVIVNLLTQSSQTFSATSNQTTLALTKAEPYSWKVRSIGETGSTPVESEQWKFYLAGDAIVYYAPFPTELISPRSGANITPDINNLILLTWKGSDVDGDLSSYQVYIDQTDASTLKTALNYETNETSLEVEVENNTTYYWKVIAIDTNGNQSDSGVYAFRTN